VQTENLYRELFARQRDSWEVPEIDDPYLLLVDVFGASSFDAADGTGIRKHDDSDKSKFKCLYYESKVPRAFDLGEKRKPSGACATAPSRSEFDVSWDCLTEGLLRFMNWDNVVAAGGAVAGCVSPLPDDITSGKPSATRVKRRRYFHDTFLPGSDIDLFLYGLNETQAEAKLVEIFDAVQAANPYEVRAFRSTHAITLVSRYPFRHVQVVLRLYNSPAEVLMGFDVDACAVGFDGSRILACPRAILAMVTQSNTVDMSRRSPSYEMRLAKYAQRGYEIVVPNLDRSRVDPFLYEKRFDQAHGLARLLLLEKLRTPEERLRYRIEGQLKRGAGRGGSGTNYILQARLHKMMKDSRNLERKEGIEGIIPPSGAESSDYSTIFLPWGPGWTAESIERLVKKKDRLLNKVEFTPDGRVVKCRRPFKIHVCAVGTMEEVIENPFPDDPPLPENLPAESLESCVHGRLSWLVDNPGRQQIGSFHPITDGDWTEGAYISHATEELIAAALVNDDVTVSSMLASCASDKDARHLLHTRDFLGRSPLHAAALGCATKVYPILLAHSAADADFLQARLVDGRTALHLAAMRGDEDLVTHILDKRQTLARFAAEKGKEEDFLVDNAAITAAAVEILDIDGADWEVKINPLQYAVAFGHVGVVRLLLQHNSSARKVAVHKDRNESLSVLSLLVFHARESGSEVDLDITQQILEALLDAGAQTTQVDTSGRTCWHELAANPPAMHKILEMFLRQDAARNGGSARALDVLDHQLCTPLYTATVCGNACAIKALLGAGATACFSEEDWSARLRRIREASSTRYHSGMSNQEMLRCPIALAAQNADWPCLEAFVSHDRTLANAVIFMPRQNVHGIQQRDAKEPLKPLDLLERLRKQLTEGKNFPGMAERVQEATARVSQAKGEQDSFPKGSYTHHLWSLVVSREEQALAQAEAQANAKEIAKEQEEARAKATRQIEKSCQILRDAAGELSQTDTANTDQKVQGIGTYGVSHGGSNLQDVLRKFSEMPPLDFSCAVSMSMAVFWRGFQGKQFTCLPSSYQSKALELMDAAFKGDAGVIMSMSSNIQMCISDCAGITPLFASVTAREFDTMSAIYSAAEAQFDLHVEKLKKLARPSTSDGSEEQAKNENDIKHQIHRLNNLDISAGETPQSKVTPDQMRQKLEAAEHAAEQQEGSVNAAGPVSSPVSPEVLLLHRSIVLGSSEPRLVDLFKRLALEQPDVFSNEINVPIRLRPIELAVIRADFQMVTLLLDVAISMGTKQQKAKGSINADESDENGYDTQSSEHEEDDSYSSSDDDEEYYNERGCHNSQQPQESIVPSLSYAQLRWFLVGEGSCNSDLGGMSLLQLAIAMDDCPIFCALASFAAELSLPRGAIAAWKREEEEKQEADEATKSKCEQDTNGILGVSQFSYNHGLPLWKSSEQQHAPVFPTPLQFALSVGARNISCALMSGDADDALLGWITSLGAAALESVSPKGKLAAYGGVQKAYDGPALAGRWLINHVSESGVTRGDLALKLVRPTAIDGIGRNALFYAKADVISDVIESAVGAMSQADSMDAPTEVGKTLFLETVTSQGSVTPLMAASSAGDIDRVRVLCDAGCNRSKPHGPKKWGPLHLAIPSKRADMAKWVRAREIIQLILCGASEKESEESLVCPGAEHTPLMLAADRGADGPTISLLLKKTAECALEGLTRRDSELNAAIHLAVREALINKAPSSFTTSPPSSRLTSPNSRVDSISALLAWPKPPGVLSPGAENACGTTSAELALEAMASVWGNRTAYQAAHARTRRGNLSFVSALIIDDENGSVIGPSIARQILSILGGVPQNNRQTQRTLVSLIEVQEAKKRATEGAKKSLYFGMNSHGRQLGDNYQSEPNGPPVVLSANRGATIGVQGYQWPSPRGI